MRLCNSLLIVLFSYLCLAHEARPALLKINETAQNEFEVFWKVPARNNSRPQIKLQFDNTIQSKDRSLWKNAGAAAYQKFMVNGSLENTSIKVEGLSHFLIDVVVNIQWLDGRNHTTLLQADNNRLTVPASTSFLSVVKTYWIIGVEHILLGPDHLLFVLALLLLCTNLKILLAAITAFTVSHSITLALASLGFISLPGAPVEAVIALSIVLLAVEVVRYKQGNDSLTAKYPWLVAFIFGLLHGLGFAGALSEIGLPQDAIPQALLFFNIGVESGQILFVGVFLLLQMLWQKISWPQNKFSPYVLPYVIGSIASFWLIDRVIAFFL